MAKVGISITLDENTVDQVRQLAEKEKRSFSQMIDLLLLKAIAAVKREERKLL
jgi:predicted transcriptional regulator